MTKLQDITKLCFLPGSLLPLKDGKYPYINLLKLGLANLGVTYPTPSFPTFSGPNEIVFTDGSNLLTGSPNLTFDGNAFYLTPSATSVIEVETGGTAFEIKAAGSNILRANGANGLIYIGDPDGNITGSTIVSDPANSLTYYDNTAHTGKLGINTSTPSVALDVVGNFKSTGSNYSIVTDDGNSTIGLNGALNTFVTIDGANDEIVLNSSFTVVSNLAGTGTRSVLADASGLLSAPVIPEYATRTLAMAGGLTAGMMYSLPISGDNKVICIV